MPRIMFTFTMLAAALLLTHAASAQQWSTIASACEVGVDSLGHYDYSDATFKYGSDNYLGKILTRCPVNNPLDTGMPKWNVLGAGCLVTQDGGSTGSATLNRIPQSTGIKEVIATVNCSDFVGYKTTTFKHTFDFNNYAYYVTLALKRNDVSESPMIWYATVCGPFCPSPR